MKAKHITSNGKVGIGRKKIEEEVEIIAIFPDGFTIVHNNDGRLKYVNISYLSLGKNPDVEQFKKLIMGK